MENLTLSIRKSTLVEGTVSVFLFLVALCCAFEFGARLLPSSVAFPPQANYFKYDAESGYDLAENTAPHTHYIAEVSYPTWTNADGCFDEPFLASTSPFIYLAGDSFTWGYAPYPSKWGTLLEKTLDIRVAKCGVPGFGTEQELAKAKKNLVRMGTPRLILVGHFENDAFNDTMFETEKGYGFNKTPWANGIASRPLNCLSRADFSVAQNAKCWLWQHSVLDRMLLYDVRGPGKQVLLYLLGPVFELSVPPPDAPIGDVSAWTGAGLLGFEVLAREQKAQLLIVLLPSSPSVVGTTTTDTLTPDFLNAHSLPYLDLRPAFAAAHKAV